MINYTHFLEPSQRKGKQHMRKITCHVWGPETLNICDFPPVGGQLQRRRLFLGQHVRVPAAQAAAALPVPARLLQRPRVCPRLLQQLRGTMCQVLWLSKRS